MISGMDTESLIKSMVDAQKLKNKKTSDKSTLLEWKQDKWKELNTKLFKLYQEDLSKLRLQGSYNVKKAESSNSAIFDVQASNGASNGLHQIEVTQLAKAQLLSGAELKEDKNGNSVTSKTKLKDLGIDVETLIRISNKDKDFTLEVTENTTITDFVNAVKSAGVNANFDETQKRLFISSKESGVDNAFEITASKTPATSTKNRILEQVGYNGLSASDKKRVDNLLVALSNDVSAPDHNVIIAELGEFSAKKAEETVRKAIDEQIRDRVSPGAIEAEKIIIRQEVAAKKVDEIKKENEGILSEEEIEELINEYLESEDLTEAQEEAIAASEKRINSAVDKKVKEEIEAEKEKENNDYDVAVQNAKNPGGDIYEAIANMETLGDKYVEDSQIPLTSVNEQLDNLGLIEGEDRAKLQAGTKAQYSYNGINFESDSNVVTINGLTLTLKGEGEANVTVSNNTQANYDMIKKFVTNYNMILKEMNELFYAPSARGYDPLSDDEKEAMSEKQIDKWEDKIKGSILRRDDTLGSLLNTLNTAMMTTVEVDGKRYSLSSFGIGTSSDYTEKGLLHIDGDEDDALVSSLTNKLMEALEKDPELVGKVISGVSKNLYDSMAEKMKAIPNVRSAFTFYNDKTMSKQQEDYQKRIKELEKKLVTIENKYYKQFAAMESALSKLQSQTNALAGMLGMNQGQ